MTDVVPTKIHFGTTGKKTTAGNKKHSQTFLHDKKINLTCLTIIRYFFLLLFPMALNSRHILILLITTFVFCGISVHDAAAQKKQKKSSVVKAMEKAKGQVEIKSVVPVYNKEEKLMKYIIEGNDTIYIDEIQASRAFAKLPKQRGKDWRKYYRLVHNFSKAYPYALVARKLVVEADSTIAADRLRGAKREKYISGVQKELFDVFEGQMRNLTVSQGALIMKLVDREVGKSSYNIIKGYKSGITAGFWQGVAKMFGSDLKKPYDPEGEDMLTEELVQIWEAGDFPAFYRSLFWENPPEMPIPEKYL